MTTQPRYMKYIPDYDYTEPELWSMSTEEKSKIFDEIRKCRAQGDEEGVYEWMKKLPLPPNIALQWRDEEGKEDLLASGANLADAEIAYGKDWLDNYMIDDGEDEDDD